MTKQTITFLSSVKCLGWDEGGLKEVKNNLISTNDNNDTARTQGKVGRNKKGRELGTKGGRKRERERERASRGKKGMREIDAGLHW